ncbi:MAG: SufB/SufD family protein [Promethearchaeota archaeon]
MDVINEEIKEKALKVLKKADKNEDNIDLSEYKEEQPDKLILEKPEEAPEEIKEVLLKAGVDINKKDRSGTYIQEGNKVGYCETVSNKVEILPIAVALQKYDWVKDYFWKAMEVDKDRYTAETAVNTNLQGYFIYARKGAKDIFPLQSCLFINVEGLKQLVHNIIIAEEDSEINLITGCTVHPDVHKALHLGISEFYLKKNSKVTFTMVHYWSDESVVRPRTAIVQEENSSFVSNYIVMSDVKDLQTNPTVYLNGDNASAYFQTLVYGKHDSKIDVGSTAYLNGKNTKAEMISRVIAVDKAHVTARGLIVGNGANGQGHLECQGLLLSKDARIESIPAIDARNPDVSITHEAAVGKIAEEQILYLESRGLSEDEARDMIIGGFLEADTSHLPPELAKETEKLIKLAANAEN